MTHNPYLYDLIRHDMRQREQEAAEFRLAAAMKPRRRVRTLHLLARVAPEPSAVHHQVPRRLGAI